MSISTCPLACCAVAVSRATTAILPGMTHIASSIMLFVLGVLGAMILVLYGVIPTYQTAHFGRVYAAYGGVFVVMSVLWGWAIDRVVPDRYDLIGALVCILGVAIIMYAPRPH